MTERMITTLSITAETLSDSQRIMNMMNKLTSEAAINGFEVSIYMYKDVEEHDIDPAYDEVANLQRWKDEAITVIEGWEKIWELLGKPGELGTIKSGVVFDEVERLLSKVEGDS